MMRRDELRSHHVPRFEKRGMTLLKDAQNEDIYR